MYTLLNSKSRPTMLSLKLPDRMIRDGQTAPEATIWEETL